MYFTKYDMKKTEENTNSFRNEPVLRCICPIRFVTHQIIEYPLNDFVLVPFLLFPYFQLSHSGFLTWARTRLRRGRGRGFVK